MKQAAIRSTLTFAALAIVFDATLAAPIVAHPPPRAAAPMASAASTAATAAATLTDACPAQLPVSQTVTGSIAGWTPQNRQDAYPFTRVAFYPGPPSENGLIVPTVEYKAPAGLHDGWDLAPRPGGYWMTCAYGNTTATVARKLADDVDFCQADYDGRFMTLVVKHWLCGNRRAMGLPPSPRQSVAKPPVQPPVVKPSVRPASNPGSNPNPAARVGG